MHFLTRPFKGDHRVVRVEGELFGKVGREIRIERHSLNVKEQNSDLAESGLIFRVVGRTVFTGFDPAFQNNHRH